jgi:hypothetical protein
MVTTLDSPDQMKQILCANIPVYKSPTINR